MRVIWLNATVGGGKTAVGQALARLLPASCFVDGDDHAGPGHLPRDRRWRMAVDALLRIVARRDSRTLVIAYPLGIADYHRLRTACLRARHSLLVVNLATPLPILLRGRGTRTLSATERARAREMRSEGYHRRRFAGLTLANAHAPPVRTAIRIARSLT